ncbi:MAG: GNAT family N-acetyltransferase [Microbacter sp.]
MSYFIEHDQQRQCFSTTVDNQKAILEYFLNGSIMTITHTFVPHALEGKGIASALTKEALLFASSNDLKVHPVCSFSKTYFERHSEWKSLKIS